MSDTLRLLVLAVGGGLFAAAALAVVALWNGWGTNPEVFGGRISRRVDRMLAQPGVGQAGLRPTRQRAIAALVVLTGVWAFTGWAVVGAGAAVAVVAVPWLLGTNVVANRQIDRLEALEKWCRSMADRLAGSGATGLVQTIRESAPTAPQEIRPEVAALAMRMASMEWGYTAALQAFADDLDDATGDDVAAALMLALDRQGQGVVDVLRRLATTIGREVRSRDEVESERAEPRQEMKTLLILLGVAIGGGSFVPVISTAYSSLTGQLVLLVILVVAAVLLLQMRRLALGTKAPRFLVGRQKP